MIALSKTSIVLFFCLLLFLFAQSVYADSAIVINEFSPHPSADKKEWVEIYNPDRVDLSNYWIDDDEQFADDSGSSGKKRLDTVQLGSDLSYQFFEFTSLLNNSGDKIVLFDASGKIVDRYEYTKDPGIDFTIGRSPDGNGTFEFLVSATRGEPNSEILPTVTPTPTITPLPTHTPTPTKIPTPTKSVTPTISKETTSPTNAAHIQKSKSLRTTIHPTINLSAVPTSVLGASVSGQKNVKKKQVLVKDAAMQKNPIAQFVIIAGSLCLIASGIIVFIKKQHSS